jgi:hypothetical protein
MRFRVGDRVKVVTFANMDDIPEGAEESLKGATGEITEVSEEYIYPYEIKFDDEELNNFGCTLWSGEELEEIDNRVNLAIDGIIKLIKEEMYGSWDEIINDLETLKGIK